MKHKWRDPKRTDADFCRRLIDGYSLNVGPADRLWGSRQVFVALHGQNIYIGAIYGTLHEVQVKRKATAMARAWFASLAKASEGL